MKKITIIISICCLCIVVCTGRMHMFDSNADFIRELGGSPQLTSSGDPAEFYACRFLMIDRDSLITIHVFTSLPRDPLTRGTVIPLEDGSKIIAPGFRPSVVSAKIEDRHKINGALVVDNYELNEPEAMEFDRELDYSDFFSLTFPKPLYVASASIDIGEFMIGELLVDGRFVAVNRYTGESMPAKACADILEKLCESKRSSQNQ